jgi:hypothetical protein
VSQFSLLNPKAPPDQLSRGIDLRCCSCEDPLFVADAAGAALLIADPPWLYDYHTAGATEATDHYDTVSTGEIVRHLLLFRAGRMALWTTWPLIQDWYTATRDWRWGGSVSGGAWVKSGDGDSGHYGPGYHWAGCSEPVLVYTGKNSQTYRDQPLRNAWIEPPGLHSRKPVGWMRQWLRRWTMPGDLVVDPYAGLASAGEACLLEGRRYLGAEIDPRRHAQAMALLAQVRT